MDQYDENIWQHAADAWRRRRAEEDAADAAAAPFSADRINVLVKGASDLIRAHTQAAPTSNATAVGAAVCPYSSRPAAAAMLSSDQRELAARLAGFLGWPIDDVLAAFEGNGGDDPDFEHSVGSFDEIDDAMGRAFRAGAFWRMIELADLADDKATLPEERARIANRRSGAWDGLGFYDRARVAALDGLRNPDISADLRAMLLSNLANAHYTLGQPLDAIAITSDLIDQAGSGADTSRARRTEAWSRYVRGNAYRRSAIDDRESRFLHAGLAQRDLELALGLYARLEVSHEGLRGIAHTCRGALLEVDVLLGNRSPAEALHQFQLELEPIANARRLPTGALLESAGWWCVFAGNIAVASADATIAGPIMPLARRIACALPNWALRERIFALEDALGHAGPRDRDVTALTIGTMARFRGFRTIGWRLLGAA